ncbi:MAG: hypothetical protein J6J11_00250 [Treponema sp.]|nr:hypothetical protein [Clostridia bacterium]MBP3606742.1 hypothetical protein [Treponema sp.]
MSELTTVSSNSIPNDSSENSFVESLLSDLNQTVRFMNDYMNLTLENHLVTIEENQVKLLDFLEEYYDLPIMTEEEIKLQEEKELAQKEYDEELLQTLKNIESGIVSQNSLLEENNRLLEESSSTLSENSISQNSIMTTKLEDYSLTDSLLLLIFLALFVGILTFVFAKKGD